MIIYGSFGKIKMVLHLVEQVELTQRYTFSMINVPDELFEIMRQAMLIMLVLFQIVNSTLVLSIDKEVNYCMIYPISTNGALEVVATFIATVIQLRYQSES